METLIFDIETVPIDEDSLSKEELEYLFRRAEDEEKENRIREMMGLWSFTAHIVSLGLMLHERKRAMVLYVSDGDDFSEECIEGFSVKFQSFSLDRGIEEAERSILERFWEVLSSPSVGPLVSFNGRSFDAPFLMLKSFILGVKATRNLMGNRYDYRNHIDILELISFHGVGRLYSLDFICRRLGIDTPKLKMKADEVKDRFREGRYKDIALYNFHDLLATGRIYERLKDTLGEVLGL